jgi:hypothetical protein
MSGMAMTPWFLRMKSPKARDMARPGESSSGSHTRWMCGSCFNAPTRPLHFNILSASPISRIHNQTFSITMDCGHLCEIGQVFVK